MFASMLLFQEVITRPNSPYHIQSLINFVKLFIVHHLVNMIYAVVIENYIFRIERGRTADQTHQTANIAASHSNHARSETNLVT